MLAWLGRDPRILPRLWLKQSEVPLASRMRGDVTLPPRRIERADVRLAQRAWAAFGAPTPLAWAALPDDPEIDRLPGLRGAVRRMLDELPDRHGLGATQRHLLHLAHSRIWSEHRDWPSPPFQPIPKDQRGPERLISRVQKGNPRLPLWRFEIGEELCALATAPVPALTGIDAPHYGLDLHFDQDRWTRFKQGPVELSPLGHRLIAGEDDWPKHNPILRWWGGTRLSNTALWRYDRNDERLIAPG